METAALFPIQLRIPDETLLEELRALASRMIGHGHRPSSFLLLRLTDGRIKMVQSRGGSEQAREDLQRITNEYGPVGTAFRVWTEEANGELVACVDNLAGSREAIAGRTPAPSRTSSPGLAATEQNRFGTLERLFGFADLTPHLRSGL